MTNLFEIFLTFFEVPQGKVNDDFCTDYFEMNFEIRGTEGLTLRHSTFDLLLTTEFH